ncbi:MAG: hypothetical protein ABI378_10925 [Chitinophagaceae bacterium]
MMTYQHWKSQTSRGLTTPRSSKLKDLDKAFENYEKAVASKSNVLKCKVAFFDALLVWMDSITRGWKSSTRNSKIEVGGKGTVETLLAELVKLDPMFAGKANKYLVQSSAPPQPLMSHGAKNHHKDVDGHHYELVVQNKENSCGPASIRTVIKLVMNQDIGEDYLRELVEMAEEGGNYSGSLGSGGLMITGGDHDWDPSGGGTWLVPAALKSAKIPCTQGTSIAAILETTSKKPAIAVVEWSNGGLHYVVVVGKTRAGDKMVILDPFYGLQYADCTGNRLNEYNPQDERGNRLADGAWYPWVCAVI